MDRKDPGVVMQDAPSEPRGVIWGTFLLWAGVAVLCLALIEQSMGLPISMPRSWYVNRALWYLLGICSIGAGFILLRRQSMLEERWSPSTPGQRFQTVVLYTRKGCHLCEEAEAIVRRYQRFLPAIEIVDIDQAPDLIEKFDTCVPVVEIDGKVRFRGKVNEVLLRRLIEGTQ
jgi:glutaredoxin